MANVIVIARVLAKSGQEKELERAWLKAVEASRKEPGCLNYKLHRAVGTPTLFVSVEKWVSQEAADAHMGTPHIQELLRLVPALVAAPPEITAFEDIS
jgi:quinol monooxygenase YgiN